MRPTVYATVFLALMVPIADLKAQSPSAQDFGEVEHAEFDQVEDGWQLQITPYFWLPSVDGDARLGPLQAEVDASFRDVLSNFNVFGAMGRIDARRDRLGLFVDGLFISVDQEQTFSRDNIAVELDADFKLSTVELGASYELFRHRYNNQSGGISLEGLGGARYTHYEQTLNATGLGPLNITTGIGGSADWVEPFVGGRVRIGLTDELAIRLYGDVGGFGVGDADLSWKARTLLDWQVTENISLLGGYQVYGLDFQEGSGPGRVGFDGHLHGPIFGVGVRF